VLWKALPEHNPMQLDSILNYIPTANDKSTKINYTQSHIKYYCKITDPKIVKPVCQARYHNKLPLKIGITQK
jgi:hypothetical protein